MKTKVFWLLPGRLPPSSEKNKILLFLKKKKQKDFCFFGVAFGDTGFGGTFLIALA
jgi:hypothetical protein